MYCDLPSHCSVHVYRLALVRTVWYVRARTYRLANRPVHTDSCVQTRTYRLVCTSFSYRFGAIFMLLSIKNTIPGSLYSCVERARIHKRSRQTRWLHFDGYSRKFAYRPVEKRGDPLKIVLYRVFIDIAEENATTGPCTYWCVF